MALELADDRRRCVARELLAELGLEPIDRVQQPEGRDLNKVVERLATVDVAERQLARKRDEPLDELVASVGVPVFVVFDEQVFVGETRQVARHRASGHRASVLAISKARSVRGPRARPVRPSRAFDCTKTARSNRRKASSTTLILSRGSVRETSAVRNECFSNGCPGVQLPQAPRRNRRVDPRYPSGLPRSPRRLAWPAAGSRAGAPPSMRGWRAPTGSAPRSRCPRRCEVGPRATAAPPRAPGRWPRTLAAGPSPGSFGARPCQ